MKKILSLVGALALALTLATPASAGHPQTVVVEWLLAPGSSPEQPWAGGPQVLLADGLPDCLPNGGTVQRDTYRYKTKADRAVVDGLLAAGVLNGPHEDGPVYLSHEWVTIPQCQAPDPVVTVETSGTLACAAPGEYLATEETQTWQSDPVWDAESWTWVHGPAQLVGGASSQRTVDRATAEVLAEEYGVELPSCDEPPVDEPPVDEPSVDEPPVDEPPVDEPEPAAAAAPVVAQPTFTG